MNPAAIVFVNNNLTDNVKEALVRQLFISEAITGAEFDARVEVDPNYYAVVHQNNLRIMVIRDLSDATNRNLADAVIFVKAGLASVEGGKFGPPGLTLPVDRLYWHELLNGVAPASETFTPNPNAQNNILYPLEPKITELLAPFGTDPIIPVGDDNDGDDDV